MKSQSKHELRQKYRQARRALSIEQQSKAALALLAQINANHVLNNTKTIALFIANDGEINLEPVANYCWQHQIETFLPVLHSEKAGYLTFGKYDEFTPMMNNRFGIPEPDMKHSSSIPVKQLDIVMMPLVAFTKNGQRLGMGGGFYDRTFEYLKNDKQFSTRLIGVAHHCQQADVIATEFWDIDMHAIVTDKQFIDIKAC
jgi:5-formyltetrahydrofolate cyclo-ligase